MENFHYGYFDSRDRPPPIQPKHFHKNHIAATASQKLCLFKLFPIIFYDVIDKIPSMVVYYQLREMFDLVFSLPFRKRWLPILRDLGEAFHRSMLIHFSGFMIPKVHFCTEYNQVIQDYGPAIKQWSMRYEAYHSYFKKASIKCNNYKNVPKMLATKYRLKQSFRLSRTIQLKNFDKAVRLQKVKNNLFNTSMKNILIDHFGNIDLTKDLIECRKFYHGNVEYCRSGVYIIDLIDSNETPKFVQVVSILKKNYKWWFLLDLLETVCYNEKLCAWEILSKNDYAVIDPCHMKYYFKGLDIYELENTSVVSFNARLTIH